MGIELVQQWFVDIADGAVSASPCIHHGVYGECTSARDSILFPLHFGSVHEHCCPHIYVLSVQHIAVYHDCRRLFFYEPKWERARIYDSSQLEAQCIIIGVQKGDVLSASNLTSFSLI